MNWYKAIVKIAFPEGLKVLLLRQIFIRKLPKRGTVLERCLVKDSFVDKLTPW
jgi:hypothetical protein